MTELNQPHPPPPLAQAPAPLPYFKDSGAALKELRKLEPPFTGGKRNAYVEKIAKSPMAKPIAFTILALGWAERTDARWNFVRSGVRQVLLGDREFPEARHLGDPRARRAWLSSEFNTDHRTESARKYVAEFSYLRPLYIILNDPDNEGWLDSALADFLSELEGAIEVARDKCPKKPGSKLSTTRQLALQISRQIPTKPNGEKSLRSHLRLLQIVAHLQQEKGEKLELVSQQIAALDRLLAAAKDDVSRLEGVIEEARRQTEIERARADALGQELRITREQQLLQKGVADAKLVDELNAQRAAMRTFLRERIQNVRLYADRPEPAREKIARLCDEMVAFLDGSSRLQK